MNPVVLMLLSAIIIASLGFGHLLLTFWGPKLLPRDEALKKRMQEVHPVITTQTTMWRAWVGFNASHSLGAILFGLVYGYLAVAHGEVLFQSVLLQAAGLVVLLAYLAMARAYWFATPLTGIGISLVCYLLSIGVSWY
jgi:hypothetical protein